MQSNSKLTKAQKAYLKEMADFREFEFATMGDTTVAYIVKGNLIEFSTAICSDTEKKNRPKVGKYLALTRLEDGESVKMTSSQFYYMLETNQE